MFLIFIFLTFIFLIFLIFIFLIFIFLVFIFVILSKRYYIGGIAEATKKETIIHFLKSKGICLTLLNLFTSKRKGTLSAKINIRVGDDEKIAVENFWQTHVYCRPWLSKEKLGNRGKEKLSAGRKAERTNEKA